MDRRMGIAGPHPTQIIGVARQIQVQARAGADFEQVEHAAMVARQHHQRGMKGCRASHLVGLWDLMQPIDQQIVMACQRQGDRFVEPAMLTGIQGAEQWNATLPGERVKRGVDPHGDRRGSRRAPPGANQPGGVRCMVQLPIDRRQQVGDERRAHGTHDTGLSGQFAYRSADMGLGQHVGRRRIIRLHAHQCRTLRLHRPAMTPQRLTYQG